jgi:hypothetical protein
MPQVEVTLTAAVASSHDGLATGVTVWGRWGYTCSGAVRGGGHLPNPVAGSYPKAKRVSRMLESIASKDLSAALTSLPCSCDKQDGW